MKIEAAKVHETIRRHQLADGFPLVVDLQKSRGVWMHDALTGEDYLDAFTCFASWPVGFNHPMMMEPEFREELLGAAMMKVSNADLYTREMAAFVNAFAGRVTPDGFPHHFWIAGGALAVENSLKTAFDFKARKLGRTTYDHDVNDLVVLHFRHAFHGRSGYTMSLTNTLPEKVGLFPKFEWPRVPSPAIEFGPNGEITNDVEALERETCGAIEAVFEEHKDKVAAIIIEPMQAEGGDRHFRPEFLAKLRRYADEREALLVFDEVQTGFFGSGKPWMWQHHGVAPDIVAFGKKTQVCGIYANSRVDEVPENVFRRSSRINSTWGGNLVDMVRCRRIIEIIEREKLCANAAAVGDRVIAGLREIAKGPGSALMRNVRGLGTLIAFTTPGADERKRILKALFERKVMALPCGPDSVRFRLPLVMNAQEADELLSRTETVVSSLA